VTDILQRARVNLETGSAGRPRTAPEPRPGTAERILSLWSHPIVLGLAGLLVVAIGSVLVRRMRG
jgi:hypothetical protein